MPQPVTIHHGDCLDVLRNMPDNSVDSIVTDPPYGLSNTTPDKVADTIVRWASGDREYTPKGRGFMGQAWDAFVPPPAVWDEVYRVLKPGGHALVFAGDRTQDLMGVSLRLAGFDMRRGISWLTGQGFPKSKYDLKPGNEPILLVRKPFKGSLKANIAEHGTGALNIDECRIEGATRQHSAPRGSGQWAGGKFKDAGSVPPYESSAGRWPANVVLDPDAAKALDKQSGATKSSNHTRHNTAEAHNGTSSMGKSSGDWATSGPQDEGGASRFFKVAEPDPPFMYAAKAPKRERPSYVGEDGMTVQHATVKPLSVMSWLVKLVTPVGGTVLDPFAGSGTTVEAAITNGFDVIGIEREADYLPLIQQRIDRAQARATDEDPQTALDIAS